MQQKRMCTSPLPQYNLLHLEVYTECTPPKSHTGISAVLTVVSYCLFGRRKESVWTRREEDAQGSDL
jgi:hypothetical protein